MAGYDRPGGRPAAACCPRPGASEPVRLPASLMEGPRCASSGVWTPRSSGAGSTRRSSRHDSSRPGERHGNARARGAPGPRGGRGEDHAAGRRPHGQDGPVEPPVQGGSRVHLDRNAKVSNIQNDLIPTTVVLDKAPTKASRAWMTKTPSPDRVLRRAFTVVGCARSKHKEVPESPLVYSPVAGVPKPAWKVVARLISCSGTGRCRWTPARTGESWPRSTSSRRRPGAVACPTRTRRSP